MFRWHWLSVLLGASMVMVYVGTVAADTGSSFKPVSSVGGYSGEALRSIYRQGIGNDYTVSGINQKSLRQGSAYVPYVGQSVRNTGSSLGLSSPRLGKAFSSISSSPTVSPYLNLFREDLSGSGDLNYNTIVKPQLEQRRMNEQLQRQNLEIARRVQSIAAQADYNPQGSKSQYPTGHQTVFMYLGHYYPSASHR